MLGVSLQILGFDPQRLHLKEGMGHGQEDQSSMKALKHFVCLTEDSCVGDRAGDGSVVTFVEEDEAASIT